MVARKWDDLSKLAELAFHVHSRKMSDLRAQEATLVEQRARLKEMNDSALSAFAGVHPAHWQSGDFHWQAWVGKNIARIGVQQAQVRALAEMHKPELRKAFGRKSVLAKLAGQ